MGNDNKNKISFTLLQNLQKYGRAQKSLESACVSNLYRFNSFRDLSVQMNGRTDDRHD